MVKAVFTHIATSKTTEQTIDITALYISISFCMDITVKLHYVNGTQSSLQSGDGTRTYSGQVVLFPGPIFHLAPDELAEL